MNSKGNINCKKRFGKSIKNRCCGYFQSQIEKKFHNTNGFYIEVPNDQQASMTIRQMPISKRNYRSEYINFWVKDSYKEIGIPLIYFTIQTEKIDKEKYFCK